MAVFPTKTKKSISKKYLYLAAALLVAGAFIVYGLETTGKINLHGADPEAEDVAVELTRPPNTVDYSPASSTDNEEINDKKQSGAIDRPTSKPSTVSVTLTSHWQDIKPGGPLVVGTIISGVNGGTCTLTAKKGPHTVTKTVTVARDSTYFTCKAIDIPASEFAESGVWALTLDVEDGSSTGRAVAEAVIEK